MALNTAQLETELKALSTDLKNRSQGGNPRPEGYYEEQFSIILRSFVLTAQVNSGIPVSTVGTAAAQTGATTAIGVIS